MSFVLVTPPTTEPLTAAEVRERLGIGAEISDQALNALVAAARLKIERQYGVAMLTQELDLVLDRFPAIHGYIHNRSERGFYPPRCSDRPLYPIGRADIVIPYLPVQEIVAINYEDATGIEQTLDAASYSLKIGDLQSRAITTFQQAWPDALYASGSVRLRFKAGFGDTADTVPETLKLAVLLEVSHLRSLTAHNLFLSLDSVSGVGEKRYIVGTGSADVISAAVSALMRNYERPSL